MSELKIEVQIKKNKCRTFNVGVATFTEVNWSKYFNQLEVPSMKRCSSSLNGNVVNPPSSSLLHPLVSALIPTWSRMMIGAAAPQRTINCACDRCSSGNQSTLCSSLRLFERLSVCAWDWQRRDTFKIRTQHKKNLTVAFLPSLNGNVTTRCWNPKCPQHAPVHRNPQNTAHAHTVTSTAAPPPRGRFPHCEINRWSWSAGPQSNLGV